MHCGGCSICKIVTVDGLHSVVDGENCHSIEAELISRRMPCERSMLGKVQSFVAAGDLTSPGPQSGSLKSPDQWNVRALTSPTINTPTAPGPPSGSAIRI